jgi:hypothetical protein
VAIDAISRVGPFYFNQMSFFYVEHQDYLAKRSEYGVTWNSLPSLTIVTPKRNHFPIDPTINLGDASTIDKILENHIDDFLKDRLQAVQSNQNGAV